LMPLAAIVVASGGWVGRAFVHAGVLSPDIPADDVFFVVAEMLARPGVFGLVMAALTAALMSTVDSLVTAIAAIVVNDVYVPLKPESTDAQRLRAARVASVGVTLLGVALVPVFQQFESINTAHGAFTAAITPPMVVALLLGVFWWRYTPAAAIATLLGGGVLVFASMIWPAMIGPFAQGVPLLPAKPGLFGGAVQHSFMRAFFGLSVSLGIAVVVTVFTRPRDPALIRGWVWGTIPDALRRYKGRDGVEDYSAVLEATCRGRASIAEGGDDLPRLRVSRPLAVELQAVVGDLVYVQDRRRWLGGLRSRHGVVGEVVEEGGGRWVEVPPSFAAEVGERVRVQRMY
ncbi:MAG: hypothetical protein KC656_31995, partial [Myxococcales bacterium]|nr:hypothetical protein [Myxococcales bacterium]